MSMEVVNGYVCKSCCDVALAKKGVDPAHPKDDPTNPAYDPKTAKADKEKASGIVTPAVVFGGKLAGLNNTSSATDPNASADSARNTYAPGNLVSVSA